MFRRFALAASLVIATGTATAEPVLEMLSPGPTSYEYLTDFNLFSGTGFGDRTASLQAVGPFLLPGITDGGCDAADFAAFAAGNIALIERGTCNFSQKVANATAAGAVGVLIFNYGTAFNMDPIFGTLVGLGEDPATIPAFSVSYDVGLSLYNLMLSGLPVTVHMQVSEADLPAAVPEPTTWALLFMGFAAAGFARRRRSA